MLAVCCASAIVVVMDISIVNVALPAIREDLDASPTALQWTVDAYALVLASFLMLAGSLADRFGRRRVFLVGLALFGIGSLCCGLALGIGWLIAARVLQAAGGTMLNPVALAIVANTYTDPPGRARAVGVFSSMTGLALALGPILGGLLVDAVGWRAVFLVNVPIVVVAAVCARMFITESRAARPRRFDPVGQLLVVVLLGSVVFAVIESRSMGWSSPVIVALLTAALGSIVGIILYEPRRADPLLELQLFRSVPFSAAILMAVCALCGFQAFLFVTTLSLQTVRGLPASAAGVCLVPIGAMVLLLSPASGRLVARRGARTPLIIAGAALATAGVASLWLTPSAPLVAVALIAAVVGVFIGMVNPPITVTALAGTPRSMAAVAGAVASTGRQIGTTLGVAIAGLVVGPALSRGTGRFAEEARGVWWLMIGLGIALVTLALLSTGAWARSTARTAAARFGDSAHARMTE